MDISPDYYTILGVPKDAAPDEIKAAFKKLALQYHPDVYKGDDAHERMRVLLKAYQTLNDPVSRRQYDVRRGEFHLDSPVSTSRPASRPTTRGEASDVSPAARRDRKRHYAFPDMRAGQAVTLDLGDMRYHFSASEATALVGQGMLRGVAATARDGTFYCHRCHFHWNQDGKQDAPRHCPKCRADDWSEFLLLRCLHCCAVFESEQIRYEIGSYNYGKGHPLDDPALCPPYELFPLCPYCGTSHWCPAEESRVSELRHQAARQAAFARAIWIGVALVALLVACIIAVGVLR